MSLSSRDFAVLDALGSAEITSQRQLAEHTGISLGRINYVLKRLLERGLVKIGNFRKNPRKIGYAYLLTPRGIEAKSKLAVRFVMQKIDEYSRLQERIAARLADIESGSRKRIVFVGPKVVCDFVETIVRERSFKLVLSACLEDPARLSAMDPNRYDAVLLFDEQTGTPQRIAADAGLPKAKIFTLW